MTDVAFFSLGFGAVMVFTVLIGVYYLNKIAKEYDAEKKKKSQVKDNRLLEEAKASMKGIEEALSDLETMTSVKERFKQVDEIIQEQLGLMSSIDGPSRGASHSKYKSEIARRIKKLEENKLAIYKTILADGVDPTLTAIIDGDLNHLTL